MKKLLLLAVTLSLIAAPTVQAQAKKAPKLQITLDFGCDQEIRLYGLSLYTVAPDPKSCKEDSPTVQECPECTRITESKRYTITQAEWGKLYVQAAAFEKLKKKRYSAPNDGGQQSTSTITVKRRGYAKKVVMFDAADAGSYDGAPASYESIATQLEALRSKYVKQP